MKVDDHYLSDLAKKGGLTCDESSIASSIDQKGIWEECVEWRISTYTDTKIELVDIDGVRKYHVTVCCDQTFSCTCPTLGRAIEMAGLYQQLIFRLFYQIGWPSWATREKMEFE